MGYAKVPSNFDFIKKIRKRDDLKLKPCQYLRASTVPRYYQVAGVLHFLALTRMILGDSAGLGKSLQTIAAYAFLKAKNPNLKLLVVTPKSAMNQWKEEFEKFSDGISVHVLQNEYGKARDKEIYASMEVLRKKKLKRDKLTSLAARKAQYDHVDDDVLICGYFPVTQDYKFLIENRGSDFMVVYDECFSYHTPVVLEDGTTELIGKIVTQKKPVKVLSYNTETGALESRQVVSWFQNPATSWYKVKGVNSNSVICSPNHTFYTRSGKKQASDLITGETIYGFTEKVTDAQWTLYEDSVETCEPFEFGKSTYASYRYNIEVEGNHNYFAGGILVSNCQEFKNNKTSAYLGASKIANAATRVYGLSATIIKNKLIEAYCIFNVIVPGLFGSEAKFNKEFTRQKMMTVKRGAKKQRFKKIIGYKNLSVFRDTIEPYFLIRRTREVASELPSIISKKVELEMTEPQRKLYQESLNGDVYKRMVKKRFFELREMVESKPDPTDRELEKLAKLESKYEESMSVDALWKNKIAGLAYCQMISNGPKWLDPDEEGDSSKEIEFKRLFEQELCTEKVIVFSRFKSGIPRLQKILDELGLKHVKVTGDVHKASDRDKARLAFSDPTQNVNAIFITQAGSAAINLQAANVLLFYDTPWSYGDLYQTIGRAQRIGSIYEHIHVVHMVNVGTIDQHVIKVLDVKKELIKDVMGDIAEGSLEFNKNEVLFKDDQSSVDALFGSVFSGQAA